MFELLYAHLSISVKPDGLWWALQCYSKADELGSHKPGRQIMGSSTKNNTDSLFSRYQLVIMVATLFGEKFKDFQAPS